MQSSLNPTAAVSPQNHPTSSNVSLQLRYARFHTHLPSPVNLRDKKTTRSSPSFTLIPRPQNLESNPPHSTLTSHNPTKSTTTTTAPRETVPAPRQTVPATVPAPRETVRATVSASITAPSSGVYHNSGTAEARTDPNRVRRGHGVHRLVCPVR